MLRHRADMLEMLVLTILHSLNVITCTYLVSWGEKRKVPRMKTHNDSKYVAIQLIIHVLFIFCYILLNQRQTIHIYIVCLVGWDWLCLASMELQKIFHMAMWLAQSQIHPLVPAIGGTTLHSTLHAGDTWQLRTAVSIDWLMPHNAY